MKSIQIIILLFFVCNISISQNIFVGNDITVTGTASLYVSGTFTVNSSSVYTNDASVEIKGDITNDRIAMPEGTGATSLTGSATQTVAGAESFIVHNVTFNNTTAGTNDIVISKDFIIGGTATFTDGIIVPGANLVTFNSGATSGAGLDNSHVNGTVKKIGNQAFTFPIGDGVKVRTAAISAPTLVTDTYTAKYFHSTPTVGVLGAGLNHISQVEKWDIIRTVGASQPFVTLSYLSSYSGGVTDLADLKVASLIGGTWTDMGGNVTGNLASGIVAATIASASWGEFTLASSTTDNPLPVTLVSFNTDYNPIIDAVDVTWETASESNSDFFSVQHSIDGIHWNTIGTLSAAGNSSFSNSYAYIDYTALDGDNYYRLAQTDFDGQIWYSKIQIVNIHARKCDLVLFPNPVNSKSVIHFWTHTSDMFYLEIYTETGQIVSKQLISLQAGENCITLPQENLEPGNYFVSLYNHHHSMQHTIAFVKIKN